jgi:hypothetical protein
MRNAIYSSLAGLIIAVGLFVGMMSITEPNTQGNEEPKGEDIDIAYVMSSEAPEQLQEMYIELLKLSAIGRDVDRTLYVYPSSGINAFVNNNRRVFITYGFLAQARNRDEIAFILSHEIAHVMLGHVDGIRIEDNRFNEFHCDMIALALMQRAGYDACNVSSMWARWAQEFGTDIGTSSHPASIQRALYNYLPRCGG